MFASRCFAVYAPGVLLIGEQSVPVCVDAQLSPDGSPVVSLGDFQRMEV